ncbi:MAG: hypothetical protein QM758_08795 [Armatimonas sp.]
MTIVLLKIGLVLLLLSMEICLLAVKNHRTYNWVPTSAPLIREKGKSTRLSFVAEGDFTYNIQLNFESPKDSDDLYPALYTMNADAAFAIQVKEDGKPLEIENDRSIDYAGLYLVPAYFSTRSGHYYDVLITPQKSFPNLQVMKPQAKIGVGTITIVSDTLHKLLSALLPVLLFLCGLGLTLAGRRRSRSVR